MLDTIYILDENKKLDLILSNDDEVTFFDYEYHSYLNTGADTFDFNVKLGKDSMKKVQGKSFVLLFRDNKARMLQIMDTDEVETSLGTAKKVLSETIGIELYGDNVNPCVIEGNAKKFFETILIDTNYKLGYISEDLSNLIVTTKIEKPTPIYVLIQNAIKDYGNIEIDFRVEIIDSINGKYEFYIDVYADGEKGNLTYKRIETDFNSYGMTRSQSVKEFCSGIIPTGNNGITIKDIDWSTGKGFPCDKPKGQDFIVDEEAHEIFSNGDKYIIKAIEFDTNDPVELAYMAWEKLQEVKNIKFDYEVPAILTDEESETIQTGDTVYCISDKFEPPIQLQARISELILSDRGNNFVLSNYKEVASGIKNWSKNDLLNDLKEQSKNQAGELSASDIKKIEDYLEDLGIKQNEIDKVLAGLEEEKEDTVIVGSDTDLENYKQIKLSNLDNGLWIGDDRLYQVKQSGCNKVVTTKITSNTTGTVFGVNSALNIRSGGGTSYKIVGSIPKGATCTILGTDSSGWYKVKYGDITGYASNKYIIVEYTDSNGVSSIVSSGNAQEYKEAKEYYAKFSLGTYANKSSLSSLISSSNKYKITTIVKYWCKRFGLDPYLVYAIIMAESSGNPYCKTKTERGGYGIMQCERAAYFNKKQTIKFLDGSTKSFTPSYSTMNPSNGKTIKLNGVKVNGNISNQIMFGCHEFRKSLERFQYNIFASLVGYNFGLGGADWCVCRYVANKNNLTFVDSTLLSKQSSKVKDLYYKELANLKCRWSNQRAIYVSQKRAGTAKNIEYYLRWYKSIDGQLPYTLNKSGKKVGYGANKTSSSTTKNQNTTISTGTATSVRNKICAMAQKIVDDHVKYKKATYNQVPRTYRYDKPIKYSGTLRGIKNPVVYDCSSFVSCCYYAAGLTSVFNAGCRAGSLVAGATKKSGYSMWKCDSAGIAKAKAGDILMDANFKVTSSNLTVSTMTKWAATHHTMIYMGNNKVAHASKWAYHPEAIKISNIDYYKNKGTAFFLRPWDLAQKDSSAVKKSETVDITTKVEKVTSYELDIKALAGVKPSDFLVDNKLVNDITINNVNDNLKYPSKVNYVFLNASKNNSAVEEYINLIEVLRNKYKKTPIIVTKEYYKSDTFNETLEEYANAIPYVIYIDAPSNIANVTSSNALTYYNSCKKAIMKKFSISTKKTKDIIQTMQHQKIHKYGDYTANIKIKMPSSCTKSYWSKLIFTTTDETESIKINQSTLLYIEGDHCTKGKLKPKPGYKYTITAYYNPDTSTHGEKYLASVTAQLNGKYNVETRKKFKGADDVVTFCENFYKNRSKFQYGTTTPLSFDNCQANISKWKVNGLYNIDCSTLTKLAYAGHKYTTSPYAKATTTFKKNPNYSWAFNFPRTAADQGKYCVEKGWVLPDITSANLSETPKGALVFYDRDSSDNKRFMGISHVAIAIGNGYVIEATSTTGAFKKMKITENTADKVVLVAYPKKY